MTKNLKKLFISATLPALMSGCATVHHMDESSCKTWNESNSKIPVLTLSSISEQKFSSACDEGRTAATVTLVGHEGKKLHPASAFVAREFLKTKREEIKTGKNTTYNQESLNYFHHFLQKSGFTEQDIRDTLPPEPQCNKKGAVIRTCENNK